MPPIHALRGWSAYAALLVGATCAWTSDPAAADDISSTSLSPLADEFWEHAAAAHLLRRAGFGGTAEEVEKLVELGLEGAVTYLVDYERIRWDVPPPPIDAILLEPPERADLRGLSEEERRARIQQRQQAEQRTLEEVRLWWIDRMAHSPRPLEEKMVLFWHGHFTSGMREVRNAVFMYEQNRLLRAHALGNFRDLLVGISKDRAMLVYLDNNRNVKQQPNENYARELLELFTLGVGNYGENDIKAAARAFTGWGFNEDGFVFRARQHDYEPKRFLGRTGRWNGLDIIDIILEQPACSRFLARNLLEFFVRPDPPRELVEALAGVIRRHRYELKPVMRTLFSSRAFYHESARGVLIKSPVELLVGTARQLGVPLDLLRGAERAMAGMGQELMQPPNVKGWDGGVKWINTATLFNRYNFVGGLVHGFGRDPARRERRRGADRAETNDEAVDESSAADGGEAAGEAMMSAAAPQSRLGRAYQPPYDPTPVVRSAEPDDAAALVDDYARRLLAVPLPESKRRELIEYLQAGEASGGRRAERFVERVRTMIHLMMSTPEYQLN